MLANIAKRILPDATRQMVSDFYYEQKLFKAARSIAMVKGPAEVLDEDDRLAARRETVRPPRCIVPNVSEPIFSGAGIDRS